ncbi:WYL domain-containing protein [Parabacteroides sp. GYB001]|uniref:helix-turn-helix transcriptional regulator n=1 Tax=Parabacteroides leei TaxID=2939491 RepID=UPI002016C5D7|nr:WYL domain-containing protein [Parabacteroides leei]MCL3854173.1 WYL domain-containing protein [Parabacteroides leei]
MPTNKNAAIRYQALDRCLSNWSRRSYIEDLVDACNEALFMYNGETKENGGVKKRQVQQDMMFLESEEGYKMMIDGIRDGHRKYYRYHHRGDSIKNQPINQEELDLIHDALLLLKRFQGIPHFDWMDDVERRLYTTSQLGDNTKSVVTFQSNPYLKGMESYFRPLFDAIVNKRVLELVYQPFGKDARTIIISPYHLKQYNNRWFLIGKQADYDKQLANIAIDRIEELTETSKPFDPLDEGIDFEEYFADVVGVSVNDSPVEEVILHLNSRVMGYIVTKPLHESQCTMPKKLETGNWEITLKVKDNYELRSLLRSFGEQIEVISPKTLREEMKGTATKLNEMYSK